MLGGLLRRLLRPMARGGGEHAWLLRGPREHARRHGALKAVRRLLVFLRRRAACAAAGSGGAAATGTT
jgi:hypothetical protein